MLNLTIHGMRYLIGALLMFQFVSCTRSSKQFTTLSGTDVGIDFRNDIRETQDNNILTYEYTYNGAGVAAGDVNNDGLPDLYFSGNTVPNKLYLNKGDWKFEDITKQSKTEGRNDWKTGVTMADVNGDGWLDIYVCYSGNAPGEGYNLPVVKEYARRANQLFINKGCKPGGVPEFEESASKFGLDAVGTFSTQAYFSDFDLDGDLDMFLVNHANMFYSAFFNTRRVRNLRHPYFGNRLYINNGNDKFEDVSADAGIHGGGLNFGLSATITDFNMDGWPDIYVTNDYEEQDFCYINNRDGTFYERSHTLFSHLSKFGMGSDAADLNNDGLQELMVLDMLPEDNKRQKLLKGPDEFDRYKVAVDSGYHHQFMRNTLQLNRGFAPDSLPRFSEVGQAAGVSTTDWSWSPFLVDLDNDGLRDIFITNGYLRDFTNLDFMKYTSTVYQDAEKTRTKVDYLKIVQGLPQTRLRDYVFKNNGTLTFTNVSDQWGLTVEGVSNGAAYADFDNDGDYDIVTNNLNDSPTLLKNNSEAIQKHAFVKIRLNGNGRNSAGIGAKIYVSTDSVTLFAEANFTRGYGSSVEPVLSLGLGNSERIKNIVVDWPDGTSSIVDDVPINSSVVISQRESKSISTRTRQKPNKTLLEDVTAESGLEFEHRENDFVDFKRQRLLYYQLSRLGGKLASGDVNGDGNDDVFLCGASGQSGQLFLGNVDGTFEKATDQVWAADSISEDSDAIFFDADGDRDLDLYVVSGGSEFVAGAPLYLDRLYINDGTAKFTKAANAIPEETTSGSVVTAGDYDRDGDLDLFVGGRHTPENYPLIPRSFVFENVSDKGVARFIESTAKIARGLGSIGMVTDAKWTDYNNDKWPDLLVVGEWMPVTIFENRQGKLEQRTDMKDLANSNGWWTSISEADIDQDGDRDYFLGNAGLNTYFRATEEQPVQLLATDVNGDGVIDPLLFHYIRGESWPLASRDELLDQIATLRKKFIKYEDYSNAGLSDIMASDQVEKSYKFDAFTLESCFLENLEGKTFKRSPLPEMAQISSTNAVVDVSGRGDFLIAGNFHPYKPQLGRSDASFGLMVNYDQGMMKVNNGLLSNVWLTGDIRDMVIVKFEGGQRRVVASRNDGPPIVLKWVEPLP